MTVNRDLTTENIESTERLIRPFVRRTPILNVGAQDFGTPTAVCLKFEFMQYSGSFKARGAFSNLLTRDIGEAGVVAASGGNHGAAVAFAASRVGFKAKIFVPRVASPAKLARIEGFGAELSIIGDRYDDALRASEAYMREHGATPIHAFDQLETVLGQATLGLEFEQQDDTLDTLLISVGGGGLIGGVAAWYENRVRVVGVEPALAPTLHNALAAGRPIDAPAGGVAADSLAPRRVGDLVFPVASAYVDRVVLVTDADIVSAQQHLWDTLRVVVEPGGATALAALLSGSYRPAAGERVGVVLCGANQTGIAFTTGVD